MKSFRQFIDEARGGSYIVVHKQTKVPVKDSKGLTHLFGTERDAWDVADKYTRKGHEHIIAKRPAGLE